MRTLPIRWLTWGTAFAAVASALWLSSASQGAALCPSGYRAIGQAMGVDLELPLEPTRAGSPAEAVRSGHGTPPRQGGGVRPPEEQHI